MHTGYYFSDRGVLESFSNYPEQANGSVSVTNGVKIEAAAQYIQIFGLFDREYY